MPSDPILFARSPVMGCIPSMRILYLPICLALTLNLNAKPKPNILLLCVDDLRPELNCYGAKYIQSPHIDALAKSGQLFTQHFVQAPTCGASRYAMLTGNYGPSDNGALFKKAKELGSALQSMPQHFRKKGYTSVSVGKVSHHPGGRAGKDWDDAEKFEMPGAWDRHLMPSGAWLHPRGIMHGLANGEIRTNAGKMAVYQSLEGDDSIYPDGLITETALQQLDALGNKKALKPFFLAVGWLKPHLPFGAPAKYMEPYKDVKLPPIPHPEKPEGLSTWHGSGEFRKYMSWNKDIYKDQDFQDATRRHYAACVTYADAQVGRVLAKLDELGLRENTIIILWGDHGWHLGEHAIWGKHSLYEESLHAPLIISAPGTGKPGTLSNGIVETIDIFPTLCDLAGIPLPQIKLDGRTLVPMLKAPETKGTTAISYNRKAVTIRTADFRLIKHHKQYKPESPSAGIELYDHRNPKGETLNVAEQHPEIVQQLLAQIKAALEE